MAATVRFRSSTRAAKKRLLEIAKVLRRRTGYAWAEVDQVTAKIAVIGRRVARQAGKVLSQAKAELSEAGVQCAAGVERLVDRLERGVALLGRAVAQAKQVVAGNRHVADRLVSVFDPDARPIRRGRLKEPTEFGYKVALQEVENGIVSGCELAQGNPPDEKLLPAAVKRHERQFGRPPRNLPPTVASPTGARKGSLRCEGSSTCASRTEATRVPPARCLSDRHGSDAWRGGGQGARAGSAF